MCLLIKDILLGFCYQGNKDAAGVPNTSFGGFWFFFWNDAEVFNSGDEFAHTFFHFCISPLPAFSSFTLMPCTSAN